MADNIYLTPLDLALLNEVFEEACAKNETASDSPAANDLATALMAAFESGIQDKAGLLAIVNKHQGLQ